MPREACHKPYWETAYTNISMPGSIPRVEEKCFPLPLISQTRIQNNFCLQISDINERIRSNWSSFNCTCSHMMAGKEKPGTASVVPAQSPVLTSPGYWGLTPRCAASDYPQKQVIYQNTKVEVYKEGVCASMCVCARMYLYEYVCLIYWGLKRELRFPTYTIS